MLGLFYFYINYLKKNNSSLCFSVFRRGSVEKHIFSTPQQIGLILISGCACILYACNFQPLIKDSQYIANCWSCWILLLSKYYHSQFNFSKIKGMKLLQIGKQDLTSNWSDSILQCLWTGQWLKYSHTLTLIPLIQGLFYWLTYRRWLSMSYIFLHQNIFTDAFFYKKKLHRFLLKNIRYGISSEIDPHETPSAPLKKIFYSRIEIWVAPQ